MTWRGVLIAVLVVCLVAAAGTAAVSGQKKADPDLNSLLAKAAGYCKKLATASLYFVCQEKVRETIFNPCRRIPSPMGGSAFWTDARNLLFDYQLIQKEGDVQERRILIDKKGAASTEKDASLGKLRIRYEKIIFGPNGLFSDFWQPYFNYKLVGAKKQGGRRALVVEASPKPGLETGHLYGKAWIYPEDGSVARIEWIPKSVANYDVIERVARTLKAEPKLQLALECGFEKNGLRFPSRYEVVEEYQTARNVRLIKSEQEVVYRNYKFFIVETDVRFKP
ncbi:MAG: hypothetical protein MUQ00_02435 [Candidatus Aminicenantes bacterium]|nr:hypothetical protein [Candidatus Aminicenantes bacterium]